MRIESPAVLSGDGQARFPTIGSFYRAIAAAVEKNAAEIAAAAKLPQRSNQVGGNLGYAVIDVSRRTAVVDQILTGIELIIDQGEGVESTTLTAGENSGGELSHYARFAELRYGRRYSGEGQAADDGDGRDDRPSASEGQRRYFQGDRIAWPEVINTLAVPRDGYRAILRTDPNSVAVTTELRAFDSAYTRMLGALDDAWNGSVEDTWPSLGRAVFEMNELRVISCFNIVRFQVPERAVGDLDTLYPGEADEIRLLSDLGRPCFYGPRFINTSSGKPVRR